MKQYHTWLTCLAALAFVTSLVGCDNIADSSETALAPIEIEVTDDTITTTSEQNESSQDVESNNAELTVTENISEESATIEKTETSAEETNNTISEEISTLDDTIGNTGMTAAEWCEEAQNIYAAAAATYYDYLCSSGGNFTYDETDTIGDGSWVCVTNYNTIEEAAAEYYSVFAQAGHESDLDEQFQIFDDKLYRLCGDRGIDISYIGSKVTALTESTEDTLTFSVISTYQFPDETDSTTEESVLTLIFERGVWRVGKFTMPY